MPISRLGKSTYKEEGGVWAITVLPRAFQNMVAKAWDVYRGQNDEVFEEEILQQFVTYVGQQIIARLLGVT